MTTVGLTSIEPFRQGNSGQSNDRVLRRIQDSIAGVETLRDSTSVQPAGGPEIGTSDAPAEAVVHPGALAATTSIDS